MTQPTTSQRIAANVRAIAGRMDITREGLARRSGIEYRTLCRLWKAETSWRAEHIEAVALAFGLIDEDGEPDWTPLIAKHVGVAA